MARKALHRLGYTDEDYYFACAYCWKPMPLHGKHHSIIGRIRRRTAGWWDRLRRATQGEERDTDA